MPCRSYCFRVRDHRTTTARSFEYLLARRVTAASPLGKNSKRSRSAQPVQRAFSPSSRSRLPFPSSTPHSVHWLARTNREYDDLFATPAFRFVAIAIHVPSPVRVIEQLLQAITERCREAGRPGRVNKADADQVAKVSSVLVAPGDQLHPHQCFEVGHLKFDGSFRFVDFGQMCTRRPAELSRRRRGDGFHRLVCLAARR